MNNDKTAYLEGLEIKGNQMLDKVKQEKAIDDFVKLTTPGNSDKSFVWDVGSPEPEEIRGILDEKSLTPVVIRITSQPFFGKINKQFDRDFGYKDKPIQAKEEQQLHDDHIDDIRVATSNMVNRKLSKVYRNLVDNAAINDSVLDTIATGTGFIKIQSINPNEVIKPMTKIKCDKCTGNENRLSCPPEIRYHPDKCKGCVANPLLKDNFEAMPIPWPPEEGQDVWAISAKGDLFETRYNSVDWVNLVNVYPTKRKAENSRDVLLKARDLPSDD